MFDLFLMIMVAFCAIGAFETWLSYKRQSKLYDLDLEREKRKVVKTIQELDEKIINKREGYEKQKQNVYDIISKRNDDKPGSS